VTAAGPAATDVERPFVSVIVPCRNEITYIARCLDSILASEYPDDRFEIIVADGLSDDGTRPVLAEYASRHPSIRVLDNRRRIIPAALNLAIGAARGELIARMDAHTVYPPNYIPGLVKALEETGADSVGGVIHTLPANDTVVARAIAVAMAHPFGMGNSHFRIGVRARRPVDHVPFFCCRREVFDRVGLFDEELVLSEDGEFSARLIRNNGRMVLVPEVHAYYFARATLRKLARMFYQYGYFKPLTARKVRRIMTVRQLVPPALLLGLAASALLGALTSVGPIPFLAILGAYAAAVVVCSAAAARQHSSAVVAALVAVFPVQHFSYGFGYLRRIAEFALRPGRRNSKPVLIPLSR
jgi:glycosyltransferase involved in cell wall biosynthesis